jgi:hypothetical protein
MSAGTSAGHGATAAAVDDGSADVVVAGAADVVVVAAADVVVAGGAAGFGNAAGAVAADEAGAAPDGDDATVKRVTTSAAAAPAPKYPSARTIIGWPLLKTTAATSPHAV